MANNKTNQTALAFGQRMMSCLAANEESLDDLHVLTSIWKCRLVGIKRGWRRPTRSEAASIADALGVTPETLWPAASAARAERPRGRPTATSTPRATQRRVVRTLPPPIVDMYDAIQIVSDEAVVQAVVPEPAAPAMPEPAPAVEQIVMPEPTPQVVEAVPTEIAAKPVETPLLVWDKTQTVATYGDIVFDLGDRQLRARIADRVRFAKGFMSAHEVLEKAKLKGWLPNRLTSLADIKRKELEAIAVACNVSVLALLSGEGLSSLAPSEPATHWLERYRHESAENEFVAQGVDEISMILASYHPALAHMIVLVLAERLRT